MTGKLAYRDEAKLERRFMGKIVAAACRARLKGDVLTIHIGVTLNNAEPGTTFHKEKVTIKQLPAFAPVDGNVFLGEIVSAHTDEVISGKYTESITAEFPNSAPYKYVVLVANDKVCTAAAVEWDGQS